MMVRLYNISMTIKELLDKKVLESGDVLIWNRKYLGNTFKVKIDSSGKIHTENGLLFNSPSGAARHFSNGVAVDGWRIWRVERLNRTLSELRNHLKTS